MKKKLSIIAVIAAVILLGGTVWFVYLGYQKGLSEAQRTSISRPPDQSNVIRYDGQSFSPKELVVTSGTTVYFVDESSGNRPMYVASAPHPAHTDYPGFDAMVVLGRYPQKGENFSFTFTKKGSWGYHDHNNPSAQGIITVN